MKIEHFREWISNCSNAQARAKALARAKTRVGARVGARAQGMVLKAAIHERVEKKIIRLLDPEPFLLH